MKRVLVLLCVLGSISFAKAQEATNSQLTTSNNQDPVEGDDSKWVQNRIGIYGSFFSGYGLSYQYQFKKGISLRTQLFAYGSNDDDDSNATEVQITYGADVQYNLKRSGNTRLYVLAGSFLDYSESGNTYYLPSPSPNNYDIERYINIGVGLGIELIAWQHVAFAIEGGYYGRFGNNNVTVYRTVNGQDMIFNEKQTPKAFGFGVGGGIFYAF